MTEINPPAWLQAGSYPARTDRLSAVTSLLSYAGFSVDEATPLRPRQGMRPSYQNYQLKGRAAATPNMTVIVSGGMCFVDNHDAAGYGTYVLVNDGDKTLTIAAAGGAGQFRKDTIVASVYDAETAGALNQWQLEVIQGPYAASAGATVRGTLPSNCVVVCDVALAPSQTSVTSGNITDGRAFTVALGGIAPFFSNGFPDHPHPGQVMYQMDTDLFVYGKADGSKANLLSGLGGPIAYVRKPSDESLASSTTLQNDDHLTLALAAGATYAIEGYVKYSQALGGSASTGIRAGWTTPGGSTMSWAARGTSSPVDPTGYETTASAGTATRDMASNSAVVMSFSPIGEITTVGAGSLVLRWCQIASNATPTIVRSGSWLRATRLS
ncbi:hypothetical protein [Streptomyces sp. RKAG337]|uniref:hypothetical protein n=1 Tax=Streptomyces sp. RKAG337 TaxID=2893404 RepID=UPI002033D9FF|nr:hypothetical protein [Streptomyces sp. RKAG337]MCM2427391.1 hypothetical protein [Streptomyces sp. RKAG337]